MKNPGDRQQNAHEVAVVLDHMITELMPAACALRLAVPPKGRRLMDAVDPGADPPVKNASPASGSTAFGSTVFDDRPPDFPPTAGGAVPKGKRRHRALTATVLAVLVIAGLITWLTTRSGNQVEASGGGDVATLPPAATAPASSSVPTTETSSAVPTVAPNLIGETLDEAQNSLPSSVFVQPTDTVDSSHPDGTVIAQHPAAGQPLNGTMQLTIARSPEIAYLDSLTPANGDWSGSPDGTPQLAGRPYIHSLSGSVDTCGDSTTTVEYDIAKGYRKFITTAGIDDESSNSSLIVNLEVFGDDRKLYSANITYGKPVQLHLDVSGVLRLKIEYQAVGDDQCDSNDFVLGTAQLQGLPGEVPTSVSEDPSAAEPTN